MNQVLTGPLHSHRDVHNEGEHLTPAGWGDSSPDVYGSLGLYIFTVPHACSSMSQRLFVFSTWVNERVKHGSYIKLFKYTQFLRKVHLLKAHFPSRHVSGLPPPSLTSPLLFHFHSVFHLFVSKLFLSSVFTSHSTKLCSKLCILPSVMSMPKLHQTRSLPLGRFASLMAQSG